MKDKSTKYEKGQSDISNRKDMCHEVWGGWKCR